MNFSYDYFHNLEDVELWLCNPDRRYLFSLHAYDRNAKLRFNDLSTLEFTVSSTMSDGHGNTIDAEYYDYIETNRLIYATQIGWFRITSVDENDNGVNQTKTITTESYQSVLKNLGFISEERVYKFYDPDDPTDSLYDSSDVSGIPSVVGQLYQQMGIKLDLRSDKSYVPSEGYQEWTITYISNQLYYSAIQGANPICRTFKENTTFGYDWITNDVCEAFNIVFDFDFNHLAIKIMTISEATTKTDVCLSHHNVINNIQLTEASENIVTVMSCSGSGVNITGVNPTGANYIVDFSYYMDEVNHRWMSQELIDALKQWKEAVEDPATVDAYKDLVKQLRDAYLEMTTYEEIVQELSLRKTDLEEAQRQLTQRISTNSQGDTPCGIVAVERVDIGECSMVEWSQWYDNPFTNNTSITVHRSVPEWNADEQKWEWNESANDGFYISDLSLPFDPDEESPSYGCYYFMDGSDNSTYCKLNGGAEIVIEKDTNGNIVYDTNGDAKKQTIYACTGFIKYSGCAKTEEDGQITSSIQRWITYYQRETDIFQDSMRITNTTIGQYTSDLSEITSGLNLISYIMSLPNGVDLLRDLRCYWIEGDYTDDHIAVQDDTTPAEEIDLAEQLLDVGKTELEKVCRPRFSFSISANSALFNYTFKEQLQALQLGHVIYIEKEDGVWYEPALLEFSWNLDSKDEPSMTFANALRLDDWGYTYADLIAGASSTSRQISANWSNITSYSRNEKQIGELLRAPLDATLRAGFANATNQEFKVDSNGILGRKASDDGDDIFEPEQLMISNNLIMFTADGWRTVKTALGKIKYEGEISYGLIADTIVGDLLVGNKLHIRNSDNTILLDGGGITIRKKVETANEAVDYEDVFRADTNGNLVLSGTVYATGGEVGGWTISETEISDFAENDRGGRRGACIRPPHLHSTASDAIIAVSYTDPNDIEGSSQFYVDTIGCIHIQPDGADIKALIGMNSKEDIGDLGAGIRIYANDGTTGVHCWKISAGTSAITFIYNNGGWSGNLSGTWTLNDKQIKTT